VLAEGELVVICAFCGRMRSRDGVWISLPPCPSHVLRQEIGWISHTYCPECLARHFPTHRTGAAQGVERSSRSRMSQ